MEKETRQRLERLTQASRRLLEQEFREQLEGRYDILLDGRIPLAPGAHLSPRERVLWDKLVAAVAHKRSQGITSAAAVAAYLREAAFHTLNRFVALKMLEARKLVQECISRGENSAGYKEFIALAPGLVALPDKGYRLYVETIFDEIAQEVRALFDRRDAATLLWPRRQALLDLLATLNDPEVAMVWGEDETIGWVYQYFNAEDERRQMRAESQAPRNSRELAVRNQFFTPRYVVQFLTDNSLGRTWCEMRAGDTQLARLDYLVKPEEGFEARAPKDPRDLRILDPACGSGHFLLYAFDLLAGDPTRSFFGIYEEAWRADDAPKSEVTGRTLKEDYASELALRRAVPELVLKHNLHGVDIDPRAAQIAGLALWMRAQRAYNDHKVAAQDRPLIGRTNIVTAEPMPGDRSLVAEFAAALRPQVLNDLFQRMVEEMRLAGELGSLLNIDRALQSAVAKAREQFVREHREPQKFLPGLEPSRKPQLEFDLSGVSDESFFDSAEERIVQALQQYAAGAPASMSVRRQLFADDAAQGIAFIDLCRKRFDVVLMNPPFGLAPLNGKDLLQAQYPDDWTELYACFVSRAYSLLLHGGYAGAITSNLWLVSKRQRPMREKLLAGSQLTVLADLGGGVLDGATVDTCAFVIHNARGSGTRPAHYLDLNAERERHDGMKDLPWLTIDTSLFSLLPNIPFSFHFNQDLLRHWRGGETLEPDVATVVTGNSTFDNFRFLRLHFEVSEEFCAVEDRSWVWYDKGGYFQPFFNPTRLVWRFAKEARENRAFQQAKYGTDAQVRQSSRYWLNSGLCFSRATSIGFSPRVLLAGVVTNEKSIAIYVRDRAQEMALLGLLASSFAQEFLNVFGRHRNIENRAVGGLPIGARVVEAAGSTVAELSTRACQLTHRLEAGYEVSPVFQRPVTRAEALETAEELVRVVAELDHEVGTLLFGGSSIPLTDTPRPDLVRAHVLPRFVPADPEAEALAFVSFAIGCAFGRWTETLDNAGATGPPEAMPQLSRAVAESGPSAPLEIAVDDAGHAHDLVRRLQLVSDRDERVGRILARYHREDLRLLVRNLFFSWHIRQYSASGRSAPLYWQVSTQSSSYSIWIYFRRATGDTLFRVLNDFVWPKLDHERAKLDGLAQKAGANPSADQRREIEQQETFVGELQALKTEVARVAPLWKPNLDDGVILNFAPLWRLVPQSRSWQGECKKAWDKLVAGDYDWAHLAMHLWPERVVPKCIDDRSLAIAHGLEHVFWHEDDSGSWRKSRVDDATVQKLIHERTSTTVKAALKDLLSATTPTASKGRKAKSQSASSRTAAPKPTPAAARATTPETSVDEATLSAVKAAIASVADGASKADVLAATGLTDGDWNKAIAALLDRGDVTHTGQKRGTRYYSGEGGGI